MTQDGDEVFTEDLGNGIKMVRFGDPRPAFRLLNAFRDSMRLPETPSYFRYHLAELLEPDRETWTYSQWRNYGSGWQLFTREVPPLERNAPVRIQLGVNDAHFEPRAIEWFPVPGVDPVRAILAARGLRLPR